jgi:hypothetical protein
LEWSWDAAPADVARTHGLGRSGGTVRAHYRALPSMAGRGQVEGGRNPAGVVLVATSLARKYGPSNRKAAMARRKATRAGCPLSQAGFGARLVTQLRLSARHPPRSSRGQTGRPTLRGGAERTARGRRSIQTFGCLIIASGTARGTRLRCVNLRLTAL